MDTLRNLFAIEIKLFKEKSKINEIITEVHFLTLLHPNPNPFRQWKTEKLEIESSIKKVFQGSNQITSII